MHIIILTLKLYNMESYTTTAKTHSIGPTQFAIFRIILGFYLAWHFNSLIPYSPEIFGSNGVIPDPTMMPNWRIASVFLPVFKSDYHLKIFLGFLTIVSTMFAIGVYRRTCSAIMLYGWIFLFNRNIFIANPGIPYVGWLLLISIIIPNGENYCLQIQKESDKKNWHVNIIITWAAIIIMMGGYTFSGIHKLQCQSWLDGSALRHILSGLLARDNFLVDFLLNSPEIVLQVATWMSLFAEISSLFIGIAYHTRKWYWLFFMSMHIGVICLVNFMDLTLGVMMIHIFTFETRWLDEFPFNLMKKFNADKQSNRNKRR